MANQPSSASTAQESRAKPQTATPSPVKRRRIDVTPKSPTWKDPRDLLADLLLAFDRKSAKIGSERSHRLLLRIFPESREERAEIYRREITQAEPLLRKLVARAESLREWPLRRPDAYEREWTSIISDWNQAIRDHGWQDMPPLCEVCGVPIFRGAPVYQTKEGAPELSFACSDRCRNAKRQRNHRQRAKLKELSDDNG